MTYDTNINLKGMLVILYIRRYQILDGCMILEREIVKIISIDIIIDIFWNWKESRKLF